MTGKLMEEKKLLIFNRYKNILEFLGFEGPELKNITNLKDLRELFDIYISTSLENEGFFLNGKLNTRYKIDYTDIYLDLNDFNLNSFFHHLKNGRYLLNINSTLEEVLFEDGYIYPIINDLKQEGLSYYSYFMDYIDQELWINIMNYSKKSFFEHKINFFNLEIEENIIDFNDMSKKSIDFVIKDFLNEKIESEDGLFLTGPILTKNYKV